MLLLQCALCPAQDLENLTRLRDATNWRTSSTNKNWKTSNVDFVPVLPGKTLTLADIKGPGSIRRIWMTVLPSEPGFSRLMSLRIYWDGEKEPSVQCPIGDFFGVGHGVQAVVDSIPVHTSAEGRARSCYWVMPFRKSARVTITNDGSKATWGLYYQLDGVYEKVSAGTPTFHAMYRQEFPAKKGDYLIADIKGRGQYVGTVVSVRSLSEGWFGEGNDYFYVDGAVEPTLRGTGFEDYFGEAWALRVTNGPYSGCPFFDGGFVGGRASCYRWHVPDPIHFERSLRVEIQHQGVGQNAKGEWVNNVERPDEYSSAAFWYQLGPHAPYPPLPPGPDRLPFDYRNFIEATSLKLAPPTSGQVAVDKEYGLHGDAQLVWTGASDGGELTFPFTVPTNGKYQLMILASSDEDGATGEFLIDGRNVGQPVNFATGYDDSQHEIALEFRDLEAGSHTLTLRCLGAEGRKRFAIQGFIVQPLRP